MIELDGATAVVTGGGSGIGLALARELAASGCDIVVADVDGAAATAAAHEVAQLGARAIAMTVDVADAEQTQALAERAYTFSDTIEIVCNNAGILRWGGMQVASADDWRHVLDVNLTGVVNGLRAFLPRLLAQDAPAHIVNTASYAGFIGRGDMIAYSVSKAAVVSISEALHDELRDTPIGVSVLCPANVNTNINGSRSSGTQTSTPTGIEPHHVARAAIDAIANETFYVFTYPRDWRQPVLRQLEQRHQALLDAIERGAVDPVR